MPTPKKAATTKNALSKPEQPDAALATVVGKDPLPRTELTKKLWEYIRKHELQEPWGLEKLSNLSEKADTNGKSSVTLTGDFPIFRVLEYSGSVLTFH
jgi:upstream activation factor subunit UAF30